MDKLLDELLITPSIEYIENTPQYKNFEKAVKVLEKIQDNLIALHEQKNNIDLVSIKIGTVTVLSVLKKIYETGGHSPKDFSDLDWKEIADSVSDKAILMDGQAYSVWIFKLYSDYIDSSAYLFQGLIPEDMEQSIHGLADELRTNETRLKNKEISEVEYTERNLWISLEAIMKLLSSYLSGHISALIGDEFGQLFQAVSIFSFEYGRYCLYKKENDLLAEYIEKQHILDEELENRYNQYIAEVNETAASFNALINDAFIPGFRDNLINSVSLARAAGVAEDEILKTVEDIDDFFLN